MDTENIAPTQIRSRTLKPLQAKSNVGKAKARRRALGDITNRSSAPRQTTSAPSKKPAPRDASGRVETPDMKQQTGPPAAPYEPTLELFDAPQLFSEEDVLVTPVELAPPPVDLLPVEWDQWDSGDTEMRQGLCLRDALIPDEVGTLELA